VRAEGRDRPKRPSRFVHAARKRSESHRPNGDGGAARSADLLRVSDVAVARNGGVLVAEG